MNFFFSSRRRHTFFFQAEDGIRDRSPSRGLGDVYKRQDVLRVAVTAKKFGVVEALTFANEFWLCPLNKGASDLIVLAAAASLFQNAKAFRDITKALALNYGGSYLALSSEDAVSVLGERIFCKFQARLNCPPVSNHAI